MEESHISRKERERLFRRKEIIDASVEFFANKGFNNTTLEEIAEASEFGKGTLYNYFEGKHEIYASIIEDVSKNDFKIIKEADENSDTAAEFIRMYTKEIVRFCVENKFSFIIFVREIARLDTDQSVIDRDKIKGEHKKINEIFLKKINKGIKAREFKAFEAEKIMAIYLHMVYPYIHHLVACQKSDIDIDKEAELISTVLLEGILKK